MTNEFRSINNSFIVPTPAQLYKIQQLSTTTAARSASWLSVTHASRWCHVATSVSVSRVLTKCSVRDVVVPSAVLELTWYCDFTNGRLFWFFWTVLLICKTMEIAFCLCTVIFIFYIDHASLVFRRCICTLIVLTFSVDDVVSNTTHSCFRFFSIGLK